MKKVAVLLYPGCIYFEVAGAVEVLSKHFEVLHFTPDGSELADPSGRTAHPWAHEQFALAVARNLGVRT